MKKCVFICIFNNKKYVDMFYLLIESIYLYGNISDDTDILIYTSESFMNIIKNSHLYSDKLKFEINNNYNCIDTACKARLDLFSLASITNYNKILYLDTDIIVKNDINTIYDVIKKDVLYVLEEGTIDNDKDFWGKTLFLNEIDNYEDKTAFTSGILLFNNCKKIQDLFYNINNDIINKTHFFHDQPYIVYNAFKYNLYDNKLLKQFAVNNNYNIYGDKIIHHFPGGPGNYKPKIIFMNKFLNNLKNLKVETKVETKVLPKVEPKLETKCKRSIGIKNVMNKSRTFG